MMQKTDATGMVNKGTGATLEKDKSERFPELSIGIIVDKTKATVLTKTSNMPPCEAKYIRNKNNKIYKNNLINEFFRIIKTMKEFFIK